MRLPYSYHQKDVNDNIFLVSIKYERNRKLKSELIEEGNYTSAMFAYEVDDIIKAFKVDEDILQEVIKKQGKSAQSKDSMRNTKDYKDKKEKAKKTVEKAVSMLKDKYAVTKAIVEGNFEFFKYLQQNSPKTPMNRQEATAYIKTIDIREILGFSDQPLRAAFSSLFYQDTKPSDNFFTNPTTEKTSYYCRMEGAVYNNIFEIVYHLINFDIAISEKEKWLKTFNFVYKMFGLNITTNWKKDFKKAISNNLEKFKQIVLHSKHTKYLKCASKLYEELMTVWQDHVYKNNLDWHDTHRTISAKWIGDRINTSRSTIQKELLLLEYIGLLNRIDSLYKQSSTWRKDSNEYQFVILNDNNFNEIIAKAEKIKSIMTKPLKEVTRHKLDILFKKSPS